MHNTGWPAQWQHMSTSCDASQPTLPDLANEVEAATDPLNRLARVVALAKMLAAVERATVAEARASHVVWSAIAAELGVTKQAAAKRFGEKPDAITSSPRRTEPATGRNKGEWEVTTPGGRTLLRFVRRRTG